MTTFARRFHTLFSGHEGAHGYYELSMDVKPDERGKKKGSARTKFEPVTDDLWRAHLDGDARLGIAPLRPDGSVMFGCIDVDVYKDFEPADVAEQIRSLGLPLIVIRSKSGGAHIFLFAAEPVPAASMVARLREIASVLGFKPDVEIFPKSVTPSDEPGELPGGWLNMGFFNAAVSTQSAVGPNNTSLTAEQFLDLAESLRQPPEFFGKPVEVPEHLRAAYMNRSTRTLPSIKRRPALVEGSRHRAIVYRIRQKAQDADMTPDAMDSMIESYMRNSGFAEEEISGEDSEGGHLKKWGRKVLSGVRECRKPEYFTYDDVGNGQRFVALFGDMVRYCHMLKSPWFVWDGKRWAREQMQTAKAYVLLMVDWMRDRLKDEDLGKDGRTDVEEYAKFVRASRSIGKINATLETACPLPSINILLDEMDRDIFLLNVENGTLNLRLDASERLRPHQQEDKISRLAPVYYDADAKSDVWEQFLTTVTQGNMELRGYLQRALGYCLTGDTSEKAFFMCYGPKDSGKSTLLWAFAEMLGDYALNASIETFMMKPSAQGGAPRSDLARLEGPRFVYCSEVDKKSHFDETTVKVIAGHCDKITCRSLYVTERTFQPAFKLFIACNDKPGIDEDSEPVWRRLHIVPFDHSIPAAQQDQDMPKKLNTPEVKAAMLAWAVEGCLEWQRSRSSGPMQKPEASIKAHAAYRLQMNPLHAFFSDCVVLEKSAEEMTEKLWVEYEAWANAQDCERLMGRNKFAVSLRDYYKSVTGHVMTDRRDGNKLLYRGLRLKTYEERIRFNPEPTPPPPEAPEFVQSYMNLAKGVI